MRKAVENESSNNKNARAESIMHDEQSFYLPWESLVDRSCILQGQATHQQNAHSTFVDTGYFLINPLTAKRAHDL